MTRKQRSQAGRNITYDLSNPRNIAAFEALLEDEDQEQDSTSSKPNSKANRQQQPGHKKKREKEKFFMLRHGAVADDGSTPAAAQAAQQQQPVSQQEQIQQLLDMFEGAADRSLVTDVFHASGCNLEAAADALFGLLGGAGGGSEPAGPLAESPAAAAAAGLSSSSSSASAASRAAAAALSRQQQQQQQEATTAAAAAVSWCDLPPDIRSTILSQLTPQDLARAASTCGEFRDWANAMRAHVRRLVLAPGLSYSCLKGMVSSHVSAGVMDFTRFERHIARQDPKELLPQVVALQKQEAEAALFQGLLAVAEGSTAPCRTLPVTGLVLRGLAGLTDRVLAEALQSMKGLRSLDISHCPNITNKSLYVIAKYKATQGLDTQHTQQQQQPQQQALVQPTQQQQQQGPQGFEQGVQQGSRDSGQEQQQEEGNEEEEQEFVYGWASSSSSSDDEDDGSDTGSDAADDDGDGVDGPAADAAAAAAAEAADNSSDATKQQQQQQVQDTSSQNVIINNSSGGSSSSGGRQGLSSTAAGTVGRQLAALQIQASLFHQAPTNPQATLVGAEGEVGGGEGEETSMLAAGGDGSAGGVGLQELRLTGHRHLCDDGLRVVLQHPGIKHSLAKLDITNCKGLTAAGLVLPPLGVLRELKACRVSGLKQLVLHMPATHPMATLELSGCAYLQVIDLNLAGLTSLNASSCRSLYRVRLRCPSLVSCSLAQCGMLFDFHEDAWQVPSLQQLNLFGCRRASGAQLQVVLDRLPALQWISLNGCHGINTLHLTRNLELQSVDVSGCRFLSALSCASPTLQQLTAASCSRLSSLTLGSNSMRTLLLPNCRQLSHVHVSTPAPPAEGSGVEGGEGEGGGRGRGARGSGVVLDTKGCVGLTGEARGRLAAAMAAGR